ncbi:hypothetical protein [Thermococcus sp. Bubb.Bath]|uniref:hypothetical protein n=1 Tax=Thermococcus sp. Bubb.Bath TaxID=1638242 RepID=UPI0014389C3F|nr:hypothetical protein [Thermococcus sp. Bubb.Bath]NJF25586.1 hypothetical protein [Thermococcus sp. Bubb.Bath]
MMGARKIPGSIMVVTGLASLVYLFITGDNYSMKAYPILQLNLYYSLLVLVSVWIDKDLEEEKFRFEAGLFLPIWLSIAALITAFESLGRITGILWLLWIFLPLVYPDKVLRLISYLAHEFKLEEDPKRSVLLMIAVPLSLVFYYRIIYGLQALALLALYILNFVPEFRLKNPGEAR